MRLRRGWARFTDQVPRAPCKPTLGAGHLFTFSYLILTTALFGRFHFLFVDEEMKVQGLKSDALSKVEQELKPTLGLHAQRRLPLAPTVCRLGIWASCPPVCCPLSLQSLAVST